VTRDIASVADKDTRYDQELRGDPLSQPDGPRLETRSEGGPAPRAPEPDEDPETTRPPAARLAPGPAQHPDPVQREEAPPPQLREPAAGGAAPDPDGAGPAQDQAAAFHAATQDLFRPSDAGPGEETHLVTLGRRLDPSLRIPRPVPPVIEPRPEAVPEAVEEPSPKTVWKQRLLKAARYAAYAAAGYLALVLLLILLFRFVNPPGSMLMLTQLLTGTSIDRSWASFDDISPALVRAVIVSEDGRFCEHSGIDTQAVREAIERAAGGTPRGASTISMQVIKNLFLWNAKSYVRKIIELPLTLIMELVWPKRRIIEVYLNIAEWGPGVFGAEAAARHHFGKPAKRLTSREAALLAAVLPSPVLRVASAPGTQTSRKARVVEARVKAYGSVASCVVSAAPPEPKTNTSPVKKSPLRTQPRRKQTDEWAPMINFGNP